MILSRTANGTSYRPQATPTPAGGAAAPAPTPWQPYLSTWTGTGPIPTRTTARYASGSTLVK